jgi:glycosyltransferase involved in cell wall biosynthesis
MDAYVICKNEENNIGRCVRALRDAGHSVIALDSGSMDRTVEIARNEGAEVRDHVYESHCQTYNSITDGLPSGSWCIIVDADAIVSLDLSAAIEKAIRGEEDVVRAPVAMVWEEFRLRYASLYPPKPLAFRAGRVYFEVIGHGEALLPGVRVADVEPELIHDDRKPYEAFLGSQARYGRALAHQARKGTLTWRDWMRVNFPLWFLVPALASLILRRGILDGRAGLLYAFDRIVAETVFQRQILLGRMKADREAEDENSTEPGES